MEEIANNICDICNLKDLSGLSSFNIKLHIAACQKKADKLNNKSVDSTPKSSHWSILSYYSSSSSVKSSQSGKSNSESETSIADVFLAIFIDCTLDLKVQLSNLSELSFILLIIYMNHGSGFMLPALYHEELYVT